MSTPVASFLVFSIMLFSAVASAQKPRNPTPADASPLSGPTVPSGKNAPRVQRGFEGDMKPLEVRPEIAALDELPLTAAERTKIDVVLTRRTATIERLIRENIDLLLRAQSVREGNDFDARRALMDDFREAFKNLANDGPLSKQLAAAMTADSADKFNAINKEYWRELIRQERDEGHPEGRGKAGIARVAVRLLGQEVKQTYERMIGDGKEQLDRVITELQLSPEQEGKVRALVSEFGQKTKLNPNGMQRVALFAQIARELTPEQRKKAFDLVRGR